MARLILDASALIALYNDKDKHHDWALEMFIQTIDFELTMPVLTFAEALVHPQRHGKKKQFQTGVKGLGIEVKPVLAESAEQIAELRASTKLRMPDVLVLNDAINTQGAVATTDDLLAKTAASFSLAVYSPNLK